MHHLISIPIFISILFISCSPKTDLPEAILVQHNEGEHYAVNSDPLAELMNHKDPAGDRYTFLFTESCKYFIPKEGDAPCYLGWNKALGTSSTYIHKNSHRLAWRYNCILDLFEVATYTYTDGIRKWKVLGQGDVGEQITIHQFKLLYQAYPAAYFGGVRPAPHDMHYFIY